MTKDQGPRTILFITGKLAEPALRRQLAELAPAAGFEPVVAVLPITVAALMTAPWVARHLPDPVPAADRVILPGFVRGDIAEVSAAAGAPAELGPKDLRDLPAHFGRRSGPPAGYGPHRTEIVAEINHAPRLSRQQLLAAARHYRESGADVIDLGCDPGSVWAGVGDAVAALRAEGFRVSIDSFDPDEVEAAVAAGAELVLSVNGSNVERACSWSAEVVAIPDTPSDLDSLDRTAGRLAEAGVRFRLDPILEPIGFGFVASLERYAATRRRYPHVPMLMGVGNLTELTEVDSAGVNVLLAAVCAELEIGSVLATEVIPWCASAVREFDIARRMADYAVRERAIPKRLGGELVMLRDRKLFAHGPEALAELAARITDRNYRLFAEGGELHVINGQMYLRGIDPFELFTEVTRRDAKMDPSHAFYLGYELAKAATALTLGKNYTQDQALDWGMLSRPEAPHR